MPGSGATSPGPLPQKEGLSSSNPGGIQRQTSTASSTSSGKDPGGSKDPGGRSSTPSGVVQLMSALHQNATAVVTSTSHLNGPDQILPAESLTATKRNGCVKLRREEHGMASEEPISVPTLLTDTAKAYPDVTAMKVRRGGEWVSWTYEQYLTETQLIARAFINIGLHRHHSVIIVGQNSPEWVISSLAAIFAGGISVGLYRGTSPEDLCKVGLECKADIIVVENETLLKQVLLVQHKLPFLKAIVQMYGEPPISDKRRLHKTHKKHIVSWGQMFEIGEDLPEMKLDDRLRRIGINHCCSIVYTDTPSSSTGRRALMFSHDNLTWSSKMLLGLIRAPGFNRLPMAGEEVVMSYLSLSDMSNQATDVMYTISVAGTLVFAANDSVTEDAVVSSDDALFEAVTDVAPTVFFGTVNVYERIYHCLREMKRSTSGFQRLVLDWGNGAMKHKHQRKSDSQTSSASESSGLVHTPRKMSQIRDSLAKNAVTKKYKEFLGFTSKTTFLSKGREAICPEVLQYLSGFDILVHQTYGQIEACTGIVSANVPKRFCKMGTSGKAIPGIKTKVDKSDDVLTPMVDGEPGHVWAYGRNVFMGYLLNDKETRDAFNEDNWLRLGEKDVGYVDDDGFNVFLGRPRNYITLKSGEVICPNRLEQLVRLELPCVKHAMIVGDGEEWLAVLLTLRTRPSLGNDGSEGRALPEGHPARAAAESHAPLTEETQRWFRYARFKMHTVDDVMEGLEARSGVQHVIQAGIDRVNQNIATASQMINNWRMLPRQFTYASGEVSMSGELKRSAIKERHALCIANMFVQQGSLEAAAGAGGYMHQDSTNSCGESTGKKSSGATIISQQLSQIKEEDETKTSSRNSMTPSAARRHGTVDLDTETPGGGGGGHGGLKGPQTKATEATSGDATLELVVEASKKLSVAAAATSSPDDPAGNNSESEDEDDLGEEGQMDPAERERERKSSQQRITAIVHAITPSSEAANLQTESQDPFDPGEEEFLDSLVASVTTSKQVTDSTGAPHAAESSSKSNQRNIQNAISDRRHSQPYDIAQNQTR